MLTRGRWSILTRWAQRRNWTKTWPHSSSSAAGGTFRHRLVAIFGSHNHLQNKSSWMQWMTVMGIGTGVSAAWICCDRSDAWTDLFGTLALDGYPTQTTIDDPELPHLNTEKLCIIAGSGNLPLARSVAKDLGVKVASATIAQFADGETRIQVHENVRGKDIYIIQSTGPPINDNMIELLLLISTLRRASANRITAVIPYYGYARQDRKRELRATIAAADIARMLEAMGVDRVVAIDLHRAQSQGFFQKLTPVENLSTTSSLIVPYLVRKNLHRPVIISPSGTGVHRAIRLRDEFRLQGIEAGLAFVSPTDNKGVHVSDVIHHHRVQETLTLVGDVQDCDVILCDDMCDTGSRMVSAAQTSQRMGAKRIFAYATHGLFSGGEDTLKRIENSHIQELVVCDTIPPPPGINTYSKIRYLSVAGLLADTIFRLHTSLPLTMTHSDFVFASG